MVELRRHFPGKPRAISKMRDFVRDGCSHVWNESSDSLAISQLEVAVSEVASNIVLHGMQCPAEAQIEVILRVDCQQACVEFLYPGCPFTPQTVPPPDFSGRAESGYGMYVIQQSVDEVHFSRDDSGCCKFRLIKNRTQCVQG